MSPATLTIDARWVGCNGIGRFASEVLRRNSIPCRMLQGGPRAASALSPMWLSAQLWTQRRGAFYSPGFVPPLYSSGLCVFTIHDLIHLRIPSESTAFKRCFYDRVIKPAARRAFRVVTVSEHSKAEIVAWAGIDDDKVIVAGNGVASQYRPTGDVLTRRRPYIFYLGNRKPHKNVGRLIQAYGNSGIAADFDLLLSGPPDESLGAALDNPAARSGLQFAGSIAEDQLPSYLRGAAALIIPSLYEGFGLPALEGMACGIPVIAANSTSLPEVIGDAGLLVDPNDVDSIAEGLRRATADDALRGHLRVAGPAQAQRFTWERASQIVWGTLAETMAAAA